MYPRNSASPERISVGQVVLISDGTIQTASVVITVRGQGGAESVGSGTTDYGADGTVYYTPTQAETNYTSFIVIASKALCFSCSQTIITSASTTSGKVVLSAETHTGATIPDVTLVATTTLNTDMVDISNLPTTTYLDTRTLLSADYFIVGDYTVPNTITPLDATSIRSAIGLASANMDTQFTASVTATGFATTAEIANVPTVAEFNARTLPSADYFVTGDYTPPNTVIPLDAAATLTAINNVASSTMSAGNVDGYTLEEALKLLLAGMAGKVSGADGAVVTFRAANDIKNRIVATVDVDGNRSSITLDAT